MITHTQWAHKQNVTSQISRLAYLGADTIHSQDSLFRPITHVGQDCSPQDSSTKSPPSERRILAFFAAP